MAESQKPSEEIRLGDYLWALYRRRWIALAAFLIVFGVVAMRTLFTTPIYQAYALIQIQEEAAGSSLRLDLAKLNQDHPVSAEMEIIHSRTVAEAVVKALRLDVIVEDASKGLKVLAEDVEIDAQKVQQPLTIRFIDEQGAFDVRDRDRKALGQGRSGEAFRSDGATLTLQADSPEKGQSLKLFQVPVLQAAEGVQATLRVREVGEGTGILMLTYRHRDKAYTRNAVNKIVEVYRDMDIEEKSQEATKTLVFIGKQLDVIRQNLEVSEDDLHKFKMEKGVVLLSNEASALIENVARLELQRSQIELELFQAKQLLDSVQAGRDISNSYSLPQLGREELLLSSLALELAQKEAERQALLEDLTPKHPEVMVLSANIRELKVKVQQILENTIGSLEDQVKSVDKVLGDFGGQLRELPSVEKDLAQLTRTTEVNVNIYKFLLEKHEEARIAKAAIVSNIRVIDWAVEPTIPVKPRIKINLALGLAAGLILAIVLVFLMEYIDDSLKSLDELERLVGQPIYGVVPRIDAEGDDPSRMLITHTHPKSPVSEAFRTMRTNIQFADPDRQLRSLLVTSAGPSEGKSTIVSNLSITIASMGVSTLLVDCDLRKPNLHNILSQERDPGLTSVIMGEIPWREAVRKTQALNLSLLTSGPIPPNPTELLGSRQMREFIDMAKQEYEVVLMDSPPVVAVTDAALLSSLVDGVLLVVEIGQSRAQVVNRATDLLKNVQAHLLGVVANHMVSSGLRYDYGYYSYYYSSEGKDHPSSRSGKHRKRTKS